MGQRGPKRLSVAILTARGSPLAVQRAVEERQRQGLAPLLVPVVYPLPRGLSRAARAWGVALMTEAYFDVTEHRLLCEMLALWDRVQQYKRFLTAHGVSVVDKNGIPHERPEHRMLEHGLALLLQYARKLEIHEVR